MRAPLFCWHRWKEGLVDLTPSSKIRWKMRQCLKCRARQAYAFGHWTAYGLFEKIEPA